MVEHSYREKNDTPFAYFSSARALDRNPNSITGMDIGYRESFAVF